MQIDINFKGIKTEENQLVDAAGVERYPWPIASNSADKIFVFHVLQTVRSLENFLGEIHRIAKDGTPIQFVAPYYSSLRATADPRNVRLINEYSLMYFDNDFRKQNELPLYPFSFRGRNVGFQWQGEWANKSEDNQTYGKVHHLNVIDDVMIEVVAIKQPIE